MSTIWFLCRIKVVRLGSPAKAPGSRKRISLSLRSKYPRAEGEMMVALVVEEEEEEEEKEVEEEEAEAVMAFERNIFLLSS